MKRHNFLSILGLALFLMVSFFTESAIANYLHLSDRSGTIAGTSLSFTDLSFTDELFRIKITNNGPAVNFSSRVIIVNFHGDVLMQSQIISGVIPAYGFATFSHSYPIIRSHPARSRVSKVEWLDLVVTPVENQ